MTDVDEFGFLTTHTDTGTPPPRPLHTVAPLSLRVPAFLVDVALHLAVAGAAYLVCAKVPNLQWLGILAPIVGYVAASLIHRVIVQRFWHTTVGKRLFGLDMVRTYSDRPLTVWYLTKWWVLSAYELWSMGQVVHADNGAPSVVRRDRVIGEPVTEAPSEPWQLPTVAPLRARIYASLVDVALHLAVALAVVVVARQVSGSRDLGIAIGFLVYPVASVIHRVVVQRFWHTTVGKWMFELEMVRTYSDRPLTLWYLAKWWALGAYTYWVFAENLSAKDDGAPSIVQRTAS